MGRGEWIARYNNHAMTRIDIALIIATLGEGKEFDNDQGNRSGAQKGRYDARSNASSCVGRACETRPNLPGVLAALSSLRAESHHRSDRLRDRQDAAS